MLAKGGVLCRYMLEIVILGLAWNLGAKHLFIEKKWIIFLAIESALQNKIFILAPTLTFFSVLSIVPAAALALAT